MSWKLNSLPGVYLWSDEFRFTCVWCLCVTELQASATYIGRFSETGLHEWMPFVIFRAKSRERSHRHFRANFWVGVASRDGSSTNATSVTVAKFTGESGWRVEKKCLCVVFWLTRRSRFRGGGGKCLLGHPIARATSYCLLRDAFWLQASKNAFKVGSVKFANSLSPPSIVKKVRTGSKSSQGT